MRTCRTGTPAQSTTRTDATAILTFTYEHPEISRSLWPHTPQPYRETTFIAKPTVGDPVDDVFTWSFGQSTVLEGRCEPRASFVWLIRRLVCSCSYSAAEQVLASKCRHVGVTLYSAECAKCSYLLLEDLCHGAFCSISMSTRGSGVSGRTRDTAIALNTRLDHSKKRRFCNGLAHQPMFQLFRVETS